MNYLVVNGLLIYFLASGQSFWIWKQGHQLLSRRPRNA